MRTNPFSCRKTQFSCQKYPFRGLLRGEPSGPALVEHFLVLHGTLGVRQLGPHRVDLLVVIVAKCRNLPVLLHPLGTLAGVLGWVGEAHVRVLRVHFVKVL